MLTFIQYPIADLRYFLEFKFGTRLSKPNWPPTFGLGLNEQFTRHFGKAKKRNRGPDYAWLDEISFCAANRAIRFPSLTLEQQYKVAFRRLFSDGGVVNRVEVGIVYAGIDEIVRYSYWDSPAEENYVSTHKSPVGVITDVLSIPSTVHIEQKINQELGLQGRPLAKLFAHATTPNGELAKEDLVKACVPLVLIECTSKAFESLPKNFISCPRDKLNGANLAYGNINIFGGICGVWFINYGACDFDYVRSIRLCLARLHAEREVLRCTLEALKNNTLVYKPGTESGNVLEAYFNEKISQVTQDYWFGVQQSAISEVFSFTTEQVLNAEVSLLNQKLAGARRQVALKIRDYHKTIVLRTDNILIKEVNMNTKTIHNTISNSTINAPVNMAESLQGSFNMISNGSAVGDVKSIMDTLLTQVSEIGDGFGEKLDSVARDTSNLASEVSSEKPRREWYELSIKGLKEAAEAVGEVGKPVLKTIATLLPMLIALYPS